MGHGLCALVQKATIFNFAYDDVVVTAFHHLFDVAFEVADSLFECRRSIHVVQQLMPFKTVHALGMGLGKALEDIHVVFGKYIDAELSAFF